MPVVNVPADYLTLTAALAAISDAGPNNVYTIQVAAGTYTEDGTHSMGLALKDYVNIEGEDPATVIIQSNGAGATSDAIWAIANCSVKNCTFKVQAGDHYGVHIDQLTRWFSMENCICRHDTPGGAAIACGGRSGQVITLTDVTITQGTFTIHSDVFSRAAAGGRVWEWNVLRMVAPSFGFIDFVEYKDNKVTFQDCEITAITYARDTTYYDASPEDPLFNQGYLRCGVLLYDRSGNTFGSIPVLGVIPEFLSHSGQKQVTIAGTAERVHPGMPVLGPLQVKALPGNTGLVYVGNDGAADVSSSNGFPLSAGEAVVFFRVADLCYLWLDAAVSGEGVAWQGL